MILKFTQDYQGRETAMKKYRKGQQADIPTAQALELVKLGVATEMWTGIGKMFDPAIKVVTPEPENAPEPEKEPETVKPATKRAKGRVKRNE